LPYIKINYHANIYENFNIINLGIRNKGCIFAAMSKNVYVRKMKVNSDLDKINKIVTIFSIIKNGNLGVMHIRPRCVEVLSYYMVFGFNDDTKKLLYSIGITKPNLDQINSELTKSGYLIRDERNFTHRHFNAELLKIKEYFMDETNREKMFFIKLDEQ